MNRVDSFSVFKNNKMQYKEFTVIYRPMSVFHTQYSTKLPMCQFSQVIDTNNFIL